MKYGSVRQRIREQAGFTLPEMLVTIMVMMVVLFALYSIFDMSLRVFAFGNDKVEAAENARLGIEKMEREIRAAYPVDRINGQQHVFFVPGFPATPTRPTAQSITFGNDLPHSGGPANRRVDTAEVITYELRHRDGGACPTSGSEGVCILVRRQGDLNTASFQPVVDHVVPNGLTLEYLRGNLTPATSGDGTDIGVVRVRLEISVNATRQILASDVDLRNRG